MAEAEARALRVLAMEPILSNNGVLPPLLMKVVEAGDISVDSIERVLLATALVCDGALVRSLPLGEAMGVPAPLLIGALLSASSFGSHACFYSDSTALVAQSAGCGVMEHALSQLPYALLSALLAGLAFVAIGL